MLCGLDATAPRFNLLNPIIGLVNMAEGHTDSSALLLVYGAAASAALLAFSLLLRRDARPIDAVAV